MYKTNITLLDSLVNYTPYSSTSLFDKSKITKFSNFPNCILVILQLDKFNYSKLVKFSNTENISSVILHFDKFKYSKIFNFDKKLKP